MQGTVNTDHSVRLHIPFNFDSYDYRAVCLFFACLIYGLFGSPTPDAVGGQELIIGILLALSVGIGRARDVFMGAGYKRFWKSSGQVFLLYGMTVPFVIAVMSGHELRAIMRDLLPFLFLFSPLFFLPLLRARPHYYRSFVVAVILIGLIFSMRSILMRELVGCDVWCTEELLYLENMPTVLFTCLILIGSAIAAVTQGLNFKNLIWFFALLCLSALPLAAMIATSQRASVGAVMLYVLLVVSYYILRSPVKGGNALIMIGIVGVVVNFSLYSIFSSLWIKTQTVGLNMRPQEFLAVWDVVSQNTLTFLFGIGWGGEFESPAVGGLRVNFTHNFFSSVFLKTGCVGVVLATLYILGLLERLARVVIKNPVIGGALAAPILIDLTLYASFKSLDFGLVLLMISGALVYFRQSESVQTKRSCIYA
ncbi:MAG: hypothetical protein ACTHOO_11605 [Alcanivorax sp.]